MSESAQRLSARLDAANERVMAFVKTCSDEEWERYSAHEGRDVKTVIDEVVNASNARFDSHDGSFTKAEALEKLSTRAAQLAAAVSDLSDADLAKTAIYHEGYEPWTIEELVQRNGIGHAEEHLAGITEHS